MSAPAANAPAMNPIGLRVQIERTVLDAKSPEAAAAIGRANAHARLPGLDDALNPHVIDLAKWTALVAAVDAHALGGKPLFLDPVGLRIAASSPTHPDAFRAGLRLTAGETVGQAVLAQSDAAYDCSLAEQRTHAARQRTEAASHEVESLDAKRRPADGPRLIRYRAALAWRENAAAALACAPTDANAKAESEAAAKAATQYQMLGGSMG